MTKTKIKQYHKCPVCGKYEFREIDSCEICPECGWEDDAYQMNHPDDDLGPNDGYSLNEYKEKYESGWRPDGLDDLKD